MATQPDRKLRYNQQYWQNIQKELSKAERERKHPSRPAALPKVQISPPQMLKQGEKGPKPPSSGRKMLPE